MKKGFKPLIVVIVILLVVLSIPRKSMLWDGGSIEYKSVIYKVTKVHRLADTSFYEGFEIELFGIKIFDNTRLVKE